MSEVEYEFTPRETHLLTNARRSVAANDPSAVTAELETYETQLRTFRDRLDEMETADLRQYFHDFVVFIQTCASVYGPTACAEAAIDLTDNGQIQRCDVSISPTDEPSYTGTYDIVVSIGHRPAISYCRIKDAVHAEIDRQLEAITTLHSTLSDTPEILAKWSNNNRRS